jgi:hypothetical protein
MNDRAKSIIGHGIIIAASAAYMLFTTVLDRLLLAPLFVGPIAGLWAGFGPARLRRGSLVFAVADVVLVQAVFWFTLYEVIDLPGLVESGLQVEGFSIFAMLLVPVGFLLAIITFGIARLATRIIARMRRGEAE